MGELGCDLALEKAGDFLDCRRGTLELGKLLQANPVLCLAFHQAAAGSGELTPWRSSLLLKYG
jgi:hypothetical protein